MSIPATAATENHVRLPWPHGTTMKAASSGPRADPPLPPTWNSDWASPCRPPDASRAIRDASGWNTADPTPTSAAASRMAGKLSAADSSNRPDRVTPIPIASENGSGRRSVYSPTSGWRSDAVTWNARVMSPTWVNVRA